MPTLRLTLNDLTTAHRRNAQAHASPEDTPERAADVAEKADALAKSFSRAATIEASERALRAALDAALDAPTLTDRDMLRKVAAILALPPEELPPEAFARLRSECEARLEPGEDDADPVVGLAGRWTALWKRANDPAYGTDVKGVEDPLTGDLDDAREALFCQLAETTPTTPAGLAALADVAWRDGGPGWREGSPEWEQSMRDPALRILARMRHGAHVLAR